MSSSRASPSLEKSPSGVGYAKRWWRVGCSLHVDEVLHCQDLGRLVPRTVVHHGLESLPKFNFPILYLEEDRTETAYDPYGNVRFYIEFHKFLQYYGTHLKLYLIDEFVENTKSISRLLISKRSSATLPLSLKKVDFNGVTGHLFQNQVTIKNPNGSSETLDHHLHVVVESTDDVNRWLFLHCIRRPVNHNPTPSLLKTQVSEDSQSTGSLSPRNFYAELSERKSKTRRSSIAHSDSPFYRDTKFDGSTCYMTFCEKKSCPTPFSEERTKTHMDKVRNGFFRQMDLDFVI